MLHLTSARLDFQARTPCQILPSAGLGWKGGGDGNSDDPPAILPTRTAQDCSCRCVCLGAPGHASASRPPGCGSKFAQPPRFLLVAEGALLGCWHKPKFADALCQTCTSRPGGSRVECPLLPSACPNQRGRLHSCLHKTKSACSSPHIIFIGWSVSQQIRAASLSSPFFRRFVAKLPAQKSV